jgi:hypothetical protein
MQARRQITVPKTVPWPDGDRRSIRQQTPRRRQREMTEFLCIIDKKSLDSLA